MIIVPRINIVGKTLSQVALEIAISQLGVCESGGNNRGPEVDEYVRTVGLDPTQGYPWCASFMYWCFKQASIQLGVVCPFPKTAKAVNIWNYADTVCRDSNPQIGDVYVIAHGNQWVNQLSTNRRLTDNGHTGIIRALGPELSEVSGNTNSAGSREGDTVAEHHGSPEASHKGVLIGYLRFDRAITRALT